MSELAWFRLRLFTKGSLWLVPGLFTLGAILLDRLAVVVDRALASHQFGLSGDGARQILSTIAGGMLTFTGFVFAIVLLSVQFGSQQFSPRLLRRLLRNPLTKTALGLFIATFTFSLLSLGRETPKGVSNFVPYASVAVSLVLVMLSLALFIALLDNVAGVMRVASLVQGIGREGRKVIDACYPDPATQADDTEELSNVPDASGAVVETISRQGCEVPTDSRTALNLREHVYCCVLSPRDGR